MQPTMSSRAPALPETDPTTPFVLPDDEHNRALLGHVHPPGWINPTPHGKYNLVVVGAGTAGLVSAAGAAGLGAKVALVERHLLGGDCLNVGCVPSKALISAARVAAQARTAAAFGVRVGAVEVDFAAVMERMRRLRSRIAPNDGVERFTKLGVDVYLGHGKFTGPTTLSVDGRTLEFARAVIATGARAAAPPIPGLDAAGYLTNETLFRLTTLPRRLAVIGGGPIGCEMAQSFARFGSAVTLLEAFGRILGREDVDAAALVARRMIADGVRVVCDAAIARVERHGAEKILHYEAGGATHALVCDEILVGVGRAPNLDDLGLEAAGVAQQRTGVTVDDHLATTNPRIYAAGDIASRYQFTHTADALARIVLRNALFAGREKASALIVPWCTYTSPEVAHVGLTEAEAIARGMPVTTITTPLAEVDRAILDGEDDGFVRIHLARGSDRILGATIVAAHAGEMISEITMAMTGGVGLGKIATAIHPYPTQAEAIRKSGDAYNRTRLTPFVKRLFARWLAFRRR
jgi:pyruvate/2-oxoglutarate dehydrogenase complex dihydrolipoamide dehydrogenase (E3) component